MGKRKNDPWVVSVDGQKYLVQYQDKGNQYQLYANEELIDTIWKKHEIQEDLEQDVRIGGKVCQFVVYDGVPDLSVDGILLHAHADDIRQQKKNRRYDIFTGILMILVGTFAILSFTVLKLGGEEILGGWLALVMAIGFTLWGVRNFLSAVFRKIG